MKAVLTLENVSKARLDKIGGWLLSHLEDWRDEGETPMRGTTWDYHVILPRSREPKPLTEAQKRKRQKAADSLKGIWADLPPAAQKALMERTY